MIELTSAQKATIERMLSAPAGGWKRTGTFGLKYLPSGKFAVRLESRKLNVWGVVLPNGKFLKPKQGRKTLDAADISVYL